MAKYLDDNLHIDYCSVEYFEVLKDNNGNFVERNVPYHGPKEALSPEYFLCYILYKAPWHLLCRMKYVRKCKLIENFYYETLGSYEPQYSLPLSLYGGKMKHFQRPLYKYNIYAEGMSQEKEFSKYAEYFKEYHKICLKILRSIDSKVLDGYRRQYLEALSNFFVLQNLMCQSFSRTGGKKYSETLRQEFICFSKYWLGIDISYEDLCEDPHQLASALVSALNGSWQRSWQRNTYNRIIAYGSLGKRAVRILPLLEGTALSPTELWDQAGNGFDALVPDFSTLSENDLVICLPTSQEIIDFVTEQANKYGAHVMSRRDISEFLSQSTFPEFEQVAEWVPLVGKRYMK
jgi:hypothetical protein